jgi:hypothetical protein
LIVEGHHMPSLHLVRVLKADPDATVQAKLEKAFCVLAGAFRDHLATRTTATGESGKTWKEVAAVIRSIEQPIPLSAACLNCPDITGRPERPVEVFNGLGHMEVLLAAIELLGVAAPELKPSVCAPTQQYTDSDDNAPEGECDSNLDEPRIADLQGTGFALEAYGGVNYRNNSKAALDFDLLRRIRAEASESRCFVCIRREAITGKKGELPNWKCGDTPSATCAKRHGGPWQIQGKIVGRWPADYSGPYVLLELTAFYGGSSPSPAG